RRRVRVGLLAHRAKPLQRRAARPRRGLGSLARLPRRDRVAGYYTAWIDGGTANWRDALRGFRDAASRADRVGASRLRRMATSLAAAQLATLGRSREAFAEYLALYDAEAGDMSACDLADLATNLGYTALDLPRGARVDRADARMWLERALDGYEKGCPSSYDPQRIANVLGGLARAALERGERDVARRRLREAERAAPHPREEYALEWLHLRGELALAERDARAAIAAFAALEGRARSIGAREMERLALEGRAQVLVQQERPEAAVDALERAAALVDRDSA